jgi:hypothetical protein
MIKKLFEGGFKYEYWAFMNKVYGEPTDGCLCTMHEECRSCWTLWQKRLKESKPVTEFKPEPPIDYKAIERIQIFK